MKKYEVFAKEDLFNALGLSVGRSVAYTDEGDEYVRINGDIYCNGESWGDGLRLKVKANLCNENDEIVRVDYDFEKKTFFRVGYESFSIICHKGSHKDLKYVELYPKVECISEGDND